MASWPRLEEASLEQRMGKHGIVWGQLSIVSPQVSDRSNGNQEPWSLTGVSDHPALPVLEISQQYLSSGMNWSPRLSGTVTKLGEGA